MTKTMPTTTTADHITTTASATQKVAIVNGSADLLELLETALDAGHYDVVFVESSEHAYSHIKRVQPNLIILCMQIDEPHGFQVLSMLKLDEQTRSIPVLIHASDTDDDEGEDAPDTSESEMLAAAKAALSMN